MESKPVNKTEAKAAFLKDFGEKIGQKDVKWMGALWTVEDGKVTLVNLTTSDFPTSDFPVCLGHLGLEMHNKIMELSEGPKLPDEPLPKAEDLGEERGFGIVPVEDPEMALPETELPDDPVLGLGTRFPLENEGGNKL